MNPLVQLQEYGQSPWYDYIRRGLLSSGELKAMIDRDGLRGITSNPSIFEKAIAGSADYDPALKQLAGEVMGVKEIYEALAVEDIQAAADLMRSVYERTKARDGFVSLEVSPELAHDTEGTIEEALRLHQRVGRENVMIKVPGTTEGLPAIERLLSEGINVNVTLLFSVARYKQVVLAYLTGLEKRIEKGGDIRGLASVASFFVSRIDTLVDGQLEDKLKAEDDPGRKAVLQGLLGKAAIANAKLAYIRFMELFSSPRFHALEEKGAQVQRLLWASTGTKNPRYPDTYYVDALIGPDTVNTLPAATFTAFRDHGKAAASLSKGLTEAKETMNRLREYGIDMNAVAESLLEKGVRLFTEAFEDLAAAIGQKRNAVLGPKLDRLSYTLGPLDDPVKERLKSMRQNGFARRLWTKDPTIWKNDPAHRRIIRHALGWMDIPEQQVHQLARIDAAAKSIREAGFKQILLLGMGGSSLCPEVFRETFAAAPGFPLLHVLDSTVPAQIRSFEKRIEADKTLFIVSSKSGTTTEPLVFLDYFYDRVQRAAGDRAGAHFIAITDPGSRLEKIARERRFREIFPGVPEIGGRYSALSNFGIVPAAIMGVDVAHLLPRAERMRHSCDAVVPPEENPGIALGVILGESAAQGRDKVTFIASPALRHLGAWLEQLIAESTGKEGRGIVPVDDEALGPPEVYGRDRLFVYLRYTAGSDAKQERKVAALEAAGQPVVRIELSDLINLGEAFFLWEIATAVAGALLGINPFDQPNVQESKDSTKALLDEWIKKGRLPEEEPIFSAEGIELFGDGESRRSLKGASTLDQALEAQLGRIKEGDYLAFNAYVERNEVHHSILQEMRRDIRDKMKVATTLGYGPRFLHSTGQLHKGGPDSGVFIQITSEDAEDLAIPGAPYTFGALKAAQALGDFYSLLKRGRRALRVHLGVDVESDLKRLAAALTKGS